MFYVAWCFVQFQYDAQKIYREFVINDCVSKILRNFFAGKMNPSASVFKNIARVPANSAQC